MAPLTPGENRPLNGDRVTVTSSVPVDISALLLGRVRGDRDFVFFQQPGRRALDQKTA